MSWYYSRLRVFLFFSPRFFFLFEILIGWRGGVGARDENPRKGLAPAVEGRRDRSAGESPSLELAFLPDVAVQARHLKSQRDSGVRRDKWQINLDRCYRAYTNAISLTLPAFFAHARTRAWVTHPRYAYTRMRENVHHDRNSQGDYLATDLIGSLQPTSGRRMPTGLIYWNPRRVLQAAKWFSRE